MLVKTFRGSGRRAFGSIQPRVALSASSRCASVRKGKHIVQEGACGHQQRGAALILGRAPSLPRTVFAFPAVVFLSPFVLDMVLRTCRHMPPTSRMQRTRPLASRIAETRRLAETHPPQDLSGLCLQCSQLSTRLDLCESAVGELRDDMMGPAAPPLASPELSCEKRR